MDILVLLAEGFEEIEALSPVDYLRRVGASIHTASITDDYYVTGSHNITVKADVLLSEINPDNYKLLYIPGGLPGATNLRDDARVSEIVNDFNEKNKLICAICAGPTVLYKANLLSSEKFTCYPGYEKNFKDLKRSDQVVVENENIITSMGPATAIELTMYICEKLFGKKMRTKLEEDILYNK